MSSGATYRMGNLITYKLRPDLGALKMSNGQTAAFVSILSLAASALAETDRQRELAVWFASHDQGAFGLGIVGFDVGELPWRVETFAVDRDFVLGAIEAAKAKSGWDRLGYAPREEWVFDLLERFRALVAAFDIGHAAPGSEPTWGPGERPACFELCPKHAVYLHSGGCVVCND